MVQMRVLSACALILLLSVQAYAQGDSEIPGARGENGSQNGQNGQNGAQNGESQNGQNGGKKFEYENEGDYGDRMENLQEDLEDDGNVEIGGEDLTVVPEGKIVTQPITEPISGDELQDIMDDQMEMVEDLIPDIMGGPILGGGSVGDLLNGTNLEELMDGDGEGGPFMGGASMTKVVGPDGETLVKQERVGPDGNSEVVFDNFTGSPIEQELSDGEMGDIFTPLLDGENGEPVDADGDGEPDQPQPLQQIVGGGNMDEMFQCLMDCMDMQGFNP